MALKKKAILKKKKKPEGNFDELKEAFDGKVSKNSILTPKNDDCQMRLGPFPEGTKMVPPASRGVSRFKK